MSNTKTKTIGKFFSAIWTVSLALWIDGTHGKIAFKDPLSESAAFPKQFDDLRVEPIIFSESRGLLHLKITWNPNMTNDSMFRVIVSPIEGGRCHHELCDEHGLLTHNATLFVPTTPTDPDTSYSQCRIEPGCNYTIIVENENFESEIEYKVPDIVGNIRSCLHELPLVVVHPTIDSEIMTIRWQIQGNYSVPNDTAVYIVAKVYNRDEQMVKVFNHTLINPSPKQMSGEFKWKITESNTIYHTKTFVNDSRNCTGFAPFVEVARRNPYDNRSRHVKWLIISIASSAVIVPMATWLLCKRRRQRPRDNGSLRAIKIPELVKWESINYLEWVPHQIDPSNLQLIRIIGEGAFGTVHIARLRINGEPSAFRTVAVKQLKRRPTEEQKDEFFGEIQMKKRVPRHPNIVVLIGFCIEKEPLQIVMEYVGCGDLRAYLLKLRARREERYGRSIVTVPSEPNRPLLAPPSGRYLDLMNSSSTSTSESMSHATETNGTNLRPSVTTEYTTLSNNDDITSMANSLEYVHRELHNFARQIAEGMKHLHDLKITHRDLAARNVLIDERKTLKISDFGLSRNGIYVPSGIKAVPLRWLSIEAIRDHLYSEKSDVWAFGIVLWEIGALGGYPYYMVENNDLLPYFLAGNRLEKPENCSDYLYDLMRDCWAAIPDDRPDFNKILYKLDMHERTYVDFSEISSDYVFPPTREEVKYKRTGNGHLRH